MRHTLGVAELKISERADHVLVEVHVVPRAARSAVVGEHDGRLKVALDAPPVDGAANAALIALFARLLGLARRDVRLVRGETSRQKLLALHGASAAAVRALVHAERS
jgi:uncharacterized protein (TIGR00251 family)